MIALMLMGCGSGEWVVTTWGEEFIEEGLPSSEFADGCAATFTRFDVAIREASLLDGDGEVVGTFAPPSTPDLTEPGPVELGRVEVPATTYTTARFVTGPVEVGAPALWAEGSLTCGADTVAFSWRFDTVTEYACELADLTVPAGGTAGTELTVHGDHLFYDGLENADAEVRGQAIVDADADADGAVTLEELAAVPVAPLGYQVGQYAEVTDLGAFVTFLTQTVGHVDGEGHCQVDL